MLNATPHFSGIRLDIRKLKKKTIEFRIMGSECHSIIIDAFISTCITEVGKRIKHIRYPSSVSPINESYNDSREQTIG